MAGTTFRLHRNVSMPRSNKFRATSIYRQSEWYVEAGALFMKVFPVNEAVTSLLARFASYEDRASRGRSISLFLLIMVTASPLHEKYIVGERGPAD